MGKDANLKHLLTRSRPGKPGRLWLYDGKVSMHDYSRWDALPWAVGWPSSRGGISASQPSIDIVLIRTQKI